MPQVYKKISNSQATSLNDIFRLKYPLDLLIELSAMGGNPIGPYGDISGNYTNVMESNISAIKKLLEYAPIIKMVSEECAKIFSKLGNEPEDPEGKQYQTKARLLDYVYIELMEKIEQVKNVSIEKNKREDYENR